MEDGVGYETNPHQIDSRPCNRDPRAYQESVNRMESCARSSKINPVVFFPRQSLYLESVKDSFPHSHVDETVERVVTRPPMRDRGESGVIASFNLSGKRELQGRVHISPLYHEEHPRVRHNLSRHSFQDESLVPIVKISRVTL